MPDTPLSVKGLDQAKRLGRRMAKKGINRLVSSDYLRTQQTAQQIADVCDVEVELNSLLRERNFGELRGQSYDLLETDPFAPDYLPPKGESWLTFHERIAEAWKQIQEISAATQGNTLFVTHGLVCRSLYQQQCKLPRTLHSLSDYANTSLTEISAEPPWTIRRLNCVSHLNDTSEASNGGII
jgi:broad specificity phosphatase PhoE